MHIQTLFSASTVANARYSLFSTIFLASWFKSEIMIVWLRLYRKKCGCFGESGMLVVNFPEIDGGDGDPGGVGDFVAGPENGGDLIIADAGNAFNHFGDIIFNS